MHAAVPCRGGRPVRSERSERGHHGLQGKLFLPGSSPGPEEHRSSRKNFYNWEVGTGNWFWSIHRVVFRDRPLCAFVLSRNREQALFATRTSLPHPAIMQDDQRRHFFPLHQLPRK
jgi:hypothetical protein